MANAGGQPEKSKHRLKLKGSIGKGAFGEIFKGEPAEQQSGTGILPTWAHMMSWLQQNAHMGDALELKCI
jgi:hypothetical protein